jgi:hypothetical protein
MKNKHFISIVILLIFAAVIYRGIFLPGIAARTDLFLPTSDWLKEQAYPSLWTFEGGGNPIAPYQLSSYPLYCVWNTLAEKLGLPIDLGRRMLWLYVFLIVGAASMYYLSWHIFKNRISAFISGLYFISATMNIWVIGAAWIQGPAALAFVPLGFVLFLKSLEETKRPKAILFSLLSGLVTTIIIWYEFKIAIMYMAVVLTYYLLYGYKTRSKIYRAIFSLVMVFAVTLLLNLWFILPAIIAKNSGVPQGGGQLGYIVSQKNISSLSFIVENLIGNRNLFLPLISCAVFLPLISLASNLNVVYFSLLTLSLIILSSGGAGPFGFIYMFLYKNFPFFVAFRDINKFLVFLTFPVAVLIGAAAGAAEKAVAKNMRSAFFKPLSPRFFTLAIFIFLILGATYPFFFGGSALRKDKAGSVLVPRPILKEMAFLYKWVDLQPKDYKMLLYPGAGPYQITSNHHPGLGALYYTFPPLKDLAKYFWMNPYGHSSVVNRKLTNKFKNFLELLNIKYAVLYPDYEYMWGAIPGAGSQGAVDALFQSQGNFKKINSPANLIIYENSNTLPFIYPVSSLDLVVGGRSVFLPLLLFDFDFSDHALLFNSQLKEKSLEFWHDLDSVIFYGRDLGDLALSTLGDKYKIDLWDYAKFSEVRVPTEQRAYDTWYPQDKDWIRYYSPYWLDSEGELQENKGPTLIQGGDSSATLYLDWEVLQDDLYEIWVRVGVGHDIWQTKDMGEVSFRLDYVLLGYLTTRIKNITGLKWIKIGEIYLKKGMHNLWIKNQLGINSLDQLAVVPKDVLVTHSNRMNYLLSQKNLIFMFEGERNFVSRGRSKWYIKFCGGEASQGFTLATQDNYAATSLINEAEDKNCSIWQLPQDGEYRIKLRILNRYDTTHISVIVDGDNVYSFNLKPKWEFVWLETKPLFLKKGAHNLSIEKRGNGLFELDLALIYNKWDGLNSFFEDNPENKSETLSWNMHSPTDIEIKLNNKEKKFIIFNTNYNPYWRLLRTGDNSYTDSIITNSWANGFFLKDFNNKKIKLTFDLQKYCDMGQRISVLIFSGTVAFVSIYFLSQYFIRRKRE